MKLKRTLAFSIIAAMLLLVVSACANNENNTNNNGETSTGTNGTKSEQLEPVTLKITMPGDRPQDMDKVIAEAERRMKDTLNIKLNLVFIPFSDLKQKNQISLASGEPNDLVFDGPSWGFQTNAAAGYYEPLDELLAEYAPDVINLRGEDMIDVNKVNGKIYGIPMGANYKQGQHYDIRKDLRIAAGFPEITTWEQLVEFAYVVKEKFPNIIPMAGGALGSQVTQAVAAFPFKLEKAPEFVGKTDALATSLMLYYKNNDGKVYNFFDDREPIIWDRVLEARKLYEDKIIDPDVLTTKNITEQIFNNRVAIAPASAFVPQGASVSALQKIVPEAEIETVVLGDMEQGEFITDMKMLNFLSLASVSENKERAMMFLQWTTEKENYDLLAYGIEDENWTRVGEDKFETVGDTYRWFPYAWVMNPVQDRIAASATEEQYEWEKFFKDPENFEKSKLLGFSFDTTPVQNEMAQDANISAKYYAAIFNGVVDPEEYLEQYKEENYDNVKKIQIELQKQIDAFLATQN